MPYATAVDLFARVDVTLLNSLASDGTEELSIVDLQSAPSITTALADASGDIDVALLAGGRYNPDQLAALTGNSLALLKRIVCSLAMVYLLERRRPANVQNLESYEKRARETLARLKKGEDVFGIDTHIAAGKPTVGGPSVVEYQALNTIVDRCGGKYYPSRSQRLPAGR